MKRNINPILAWSIICALALLVILVFIQFQQSSGISQKSKQQLASKEVVLMLDYGNAKVRRFKGPIGENANAWYALQQAASVAGIHLGVADHFIPEEIDGLKNGKDGKNWNLYLNKVKQKFAPFEISIKPGDEIMFKFE